MYLSGVVKDTSSPAFHAAKSLSFLWNTFLPVWPQFYGPNSSHTYSYSQPLSLQYILFPPLTNPTVCLFTMTDSIWITPVEKSFHRSTNLFNNFDFQFCPLHSLSYLFRQLRSWGSLHKHNTIESSSFYVPLLAVSSNIGKCSVPMAFWAVYINPLQF